MRLAAVGLPDSHPRDGLARQPGLAIQSWPALRPLAAPVCPSTAECPLLVLTTTVLLGPGSCSGATPPSLSQGRPDSTQFRKLGNAAWASIRNLASATPIDWPKRLAAAGRPDSHPLGGSARQPGLALQSWRTLGPLAVPVCPSTAGCRLSVLSRQVQAQPGRSQQMGELYTPCPAPVCSWRGPLIGDRIWQEQAQPRRGPANWRALRPLPARSALLLRAGRTRNLPKAWQRGLGQLSQLGQRQAHW